MTSRKMLAIRIDDATKRRLEEAAASRNQTLSTFVLQAAEAAARAAEKEASREGRGDIRTRVRISVGPWPAAFKATCREASRGGDRGYDRAGRTFLREVLGLIASSSSNWSDERKARYAELLASLMRRDDPAVLAWLDRDLPRCMAPVPRLRRAMFLDGLYREVDDDGGGLRPQLWPL